ncbi:MAG TPA: diguanylate cyclase [Planctomycetaceae bacterium]|nr:diguanylate cyclase [Planctomycetaceae bacterium]
MIDCDRLLNVERLPSLPHVVARLLRRGYDAESPPRALELMVRADPAAAARVLKFANSTYFGRKWPVVSVEQAAPLLGTTVVRSLTLMLSLRAEALPRGAACDAYCEYWRDAIAHAAAAAHVGAARTGATEADLYFAGLLLDIGRLALLNTCPDDYVAAAAAARETGTPLVVVERERFGIDHAEVSARLMQRWNFPAAAVEAARRHHQPIEEWGDLKSGAFVAPLAIASAIGEVYGDGTNIVARRRLESLIAKTCRMPEVDLDDTLAQVGRQVAELEAEFPRENDESWSLAELYSAANTELAELVVSESIAAAQAQARAEAAREHAVEFERRIRALERQALRDPLTGIYNRQFFEESLAQETARCCRHSLPIGLVFIDVDRFKPVNDTWGHAFGDRVLKQVADTILRTIRANDVLARFGGEEFVVLPGNPSEAGLARLAERIRTAVALQEHTAEGRSVRVTVSIGYTLALPSRTETDLAARLVAAADAAMYEAKHLGRDRTSFQSLMDEKDRQFMRKLVECSFSRWLVRRGVLSGSAMHDVLLDYQSEREPLGRIAIREGLLRDADVSRIVREQRQGQERFGALAVRLGLLSEEQLLRLMALQRENPVQISRIAIGQGLLDEAHGAALVGEYLAELRGEGAGAGAGCESEQELMSH